MTQASGLIRRYLRQRAELGGGEIFLDHLTAAELRALLAGISEEKSYEAPSNPSPSASPSTGAGPRAVTDAAAQVVSRAEVLQDERLLQITGLDELRAEALGCPRCRLCETRRHVVFDGGTSTAELMIVGGAPTAEEDRTGIPFSGEEGELLDELLATVGFGRESVYITNALKCRPPADRLPEQDELEACSPFLSRQVEIASPKAILALGGAACSALLQNEAPLGELRGRPHEFLGVPVVASYHPAALLRNPAWIRPVWEDLQRIREILEAR